MISVRTQIFHCGGAPVNVLTPVNASCKKLTFLRKINYEFQLANTTGDNRRVQKFETM